MLSPDPVKRGLNPYPYCDNDPVNYVDPTGEILSIVAGGILGGLFGGGAGFVGSVLSQVTDGRKINWRKAAGSAANGFVVGAARGALIGSGAGIPLAFATDFTAGSIGDALEQKITTGRVNLGKSLLGGAENALSQMLYGTGELKGVGDAFWRGAKTGALSSGFRNIEEALWPERSRDPKGMCGSPDPFELSQGFGNGRGYQSPSAHGEGGFSLGGLVKDMVAGGIVGGLGSAGFYGAGKVVDALHESFVGWRNSFRPVSGAVKLIGAGEGEAFGIYASKATPIEGYTDVIVHGAPYNQQVAVMHNGKWVYLNQRSLAKYLKQDSGYIRGPIRLLSCGTGSTQNGFAQNLANKMGVEVMAPSDTIWAFPNGKLTIGPKSYRNTGRWNVFLPGFH